MEGQKKEELLAFIATSDSGHPSSKVALRTLKFVQEICASDSWENTEQLLSRLRELGGEIQYLAKSGGYVALNVIRRVLNIIREEHNRHQNKTSAQTPPELHRLALESSKSREDGSESTARENGSTFRAPDVYPLDEFKDDLLDALAELQMEIELSISNIAAQALEHIHADEVIMTLGFSQTVLEFFVQAAKKRKFRVIIAQGSPFNTGENLAVALSNEKKLDVTLITDASIAAVMPRVHKVILGAYAVLATGGCRATIGAYNMALAAKRHAVPVIICAPLYKLTPSHKPLQDKFLSPEQVLSYGEGQKNMENSQIINPAFDHVPVELVTLFISNIGGNSPSYVYQLLKEQYDSEDYSFSANFSDVETRKQSGGDLELKKQPMYASAKEESVVS
ncbi:unnamed protein product [Cyprideis torosa]|uniref:Translation initiation factor eIF2B subunit beta n=1 Tax=Cyprideis torosa TaxID=163714 RepID=A0A7R8WAL5_9CRUS|nr:unnamed protein product [Cyprideis torosa]CAG0891139.1 unnamed protein product [Cyprideis torosa]